MGTFSSKFPCFAMLRSAVMVQQCLNNVMHPLCSGFATDLMYEMIPVMCNHISFQEGSDTVTVMADLMGFDGTDSYDNHGFHIHTVGKALTLGFGCKYPKILRPKPTDLIRVIACLITNLFMCKLVHIT